MEDDSASECVRNVATTYGSKIVQLYEYEANEYGYRKGSANDRPKIPVHAT